MPSRIGRSVRRGSILCARTQLESGRPARSGIRPAGAGSNRAGWVMGDRRRTVCLPRLCSRRIAAAFCPDPIPLTRPAIGSPVKRQFHMSPPFRAGWLQFQVVGVFPEATEGTRKLSYPTLGGWNGNSRSGGEQIDETGPVLANQWSREVPFHAGWRARAG